MTDTGNGHTTSQQTPYGDMAEQAYDNGFSPIPLDGKKPCLRNWTNFVMEKDDEKRQAFIDKHKTKNIGFRTGHLVAIDNDNDDPVKARRIRQVVFDICGQTPFIRQGRAPREVYLYRTSAPQNKMQVGGVEILGRGQQVVVHGIHPDTQEPYIWPNESVLDATPEDLPEVDKATLKRLYEALGGHAGVVNFQEQRDKKERDAKVLEGRRNNSVFNYLIKEAWTIDNKDELTLLGNDFNQKQCVPPLGDKEMAQIIHSVWRKKLSGQAWRPKQQFAEFSLSREEMETFYNDPRCLVLLAHLRMSMPPNEFCAPQEYVGEQTGWNKMTVNKALKTLTEHGFIERIGMRKVPNRIRPAIVYRFL